MLDRTNHQRLAAQFTDRLATAIPAASRTVTTTDNNPPGALFHARDALDELAKFLKDNPVVDGEAQARTGAAVKERTLVALKAARDERETKTRPLRDQLNAIFADYDLVKDKGPLESSYNVLRKRLSDYANRIEAERATEAERLRQAALEQERIAREAEAAEQEAIENASQGECTDVAGAIQEADAAFTDYRKADRQAAIAERQVPLRFGSVMGGRTQAMRTVEVLTVTDAIAAIKVLGLTDKIRDAILSSARDFRKEFEELPAGITATFERSL